MTSTPEDLQAIIAALTEELKEANQVAWRAHRAGQFEGVYLALFSLMTRSCVCGHTIVKAAKDAGIDLSDEACKNYGVRPLPWKQ